MQNKTKHIQTYLSLMGKYNQSVICGILMTMTSVEENTHDGFFFEDCNTVDDWNFGTIYLFGEFAYICPSGFQWYRFKWVDYQMLNN